MTGTEHAQPMRYLIVAAVLLGCGGDDGGFMCEPGDRSGTYWAEFETLSGNCGEQADGLVRIESGEGNEPPDGCVDLAEPKTSDDGCTLEAKRVCDASNIQPGAEIETTAVTTQQDEAGDVISGTMTMLIRDTTGTVCSGSYRFTATRQ